jgi:hypothetical protein
LAKAKTPHCREKIARRIAIAASVVAAMRVLDKVVIGNSLILDARRSGA